MSKTYNPRNYHNQPLAVIELADGTKWSVRYPRASDRHLLTDISQAQRKRLEAFQASLKTWQEDLQARAAAAVAESGDPEAGDRLIDEAEPPVENPDDLTIDYWHAEVLAAFITPTVGAGEVLERLGEEYDLDFLYERHAELMDTLEGTAAKKRVRQGERR